MVVCKIARNGQQPSAKAVGVAQGRNPAHDNQENLLHQIVSFPTRHIGQKNSVNHASVLLEEPSEGRLIAAAGRFDYAGIGR